MRVNSLDRPALTGIAAAVLSAAMALAAAGCGTSTPSADANGSGSASSPHAMPSHSHAMTGPAAFGPDCSMVPGSGMGSFHGMSMDPVVTAARHNPLLTSFAADVKKAGLAADLNGMHAITVFAPANTAFGAMDPADMTMLHGRGALAKVLKYHIVNGRVTPEELASGKTLKTLEGSTLTGAKMGSVYEVNKAHVICGNIHTANATIYVISKVLIPMH